MLYMPQYMCKYLLVNMPQYLLVNMLPYMYYMPVDMWRFM